MTYVLVTGITGFLGSRLAWSLTKQGQKVIGLKRQSSSFAQIDYMGLRDQVELHDIAEENFDLERLLRDRAVPTLYHTAGLARVGATDNENLALIEANIRFPTLLAKQAKHAGIRHFISAATSWQSIRGKGYEPFNLYAATKQAFEDVLSVLADEHFTCTSIRLFDSYGSGDYRNKIVDLLVKAALAGKELSMSPGEQAINLVHVSDVARAFIAAAELSTIQDASHAVYCVPADEPIRLRQLAELIAVLMEKPLKIKWGGRPYRPNEVMFPHASHSSVPDWKPMVPLRTGLLEVINYFRANPESCSE